MTVHRGDIYYADLSPVVGSEQGGMRPVLIVQNDIGNKHSPTVIAAAITSRLDKAKLPTHSWRRHLRTSERFRGIVGTDPYIGQEKAKGENGNT